MERENTSEDTAETLVDLGLTPVQAKILLALKRFDYAAVKELANVTELHRQEIYPVLNELQQLGLIEKKLGIPNQYKAMSLSKTLRTLLDRKNAWIAKLQKTTTELIKTADFEKETKTCDSKDYDFTLITGIERFGHALKDWIKTAHTIDEVVKYDRFSYQIAERLKASSEFRYQKDVKIRLVTCTRVDDATKAELREKNIEFRVAEFETPVDIAIYNGKRAHLAIYSDRNNILQTEVAALTSNNPCFVQMLQNYFDVLWKHAKIQK
ncbi:MAG: TrmB family transcriptional regulator [Candidatus Bathyarchaeia archaeon]|jgi:sugar-specific transcriptional regulator TrmB